MAELVSQIEAFRANIIESGIVLDPEGTHHEFVSGKHGRKLDFDNVEEGTPLYEEWMDVSAAYIRDEFPQLPEIIIGVANGTNRVALDTARRFNGEVIGLTTVKDPENSKKVYLTPFAGRIIQAIKPELVVVKEDVGTTGSTSVQVATACLEAGAQNAEVVVTWQRQQELARLEEAGIPYRAVINEPLPTYSPEECRESGFCAQGWEFIERKN